MKTLVGTGDGPEKYNGYKPAGKNPYTRSRNDIKNPYAAPREELKKPAPGKGNIGPQSGPMSPKDSYAPKDKGYYQEQEKPKKLTLKPKTNTKTPSQINIPESVKKDYSYPNKNNVYEQDIKKNYEKISKGMRPEKQGGQYPMPFDGQRLEKKPIAKIKSKIRGGMGAGRGDNANTYKDPYAGEY